jgi:hypothetical protein
MEIPRIVVLFALLLIVTLSSSLYVCYVGHGWLTWDIGADISSVIQAVGVLTSLGFIWSQLKQQASLTRAGNARSLVESSSPFTFMLLESDELTRLWREGGKKYDSFTANEKSKYHHLLIWWLSFYENIYYQNTNGLIDPQVYESWEADLGFFIRRRNLPQHWEDLKELYETRFRMHINDLIAKVLEERRIARQAQ